MKKAIATIIALICIALTCVFSACEIAQGDTPENTGTATQTEPITEDMVEETTTSPAPPNWTVYEDESLNAIINDLRADGHDMEQMTYCDVHEYKEYGYTATFNTRIVKPGETLEITLSDMYCSGGSTDAKQLVDDYWLRICMSPYGEQPDTSKNAFEWTEGDRFVLQIPANMEEGAYDVHIFIAEWGLYICPIVVYNGSAETQDWVTYEDESLNAMVNDLRAEGFDMEKTKFSEIHSSENYGYTADLNARVFRPGDTIEVNLSDLISYSAPVNAQEYYEQLMLNVFLAEHPGGGSWDHPFTTEDYTRYQFSIPADMKPGAYEIWLYLNDWGIMICPIVVYNGSAETQEWVTYEDESLNATVNDLRAEGFDMEKTNFSEIHSSNNYGYTADLNARVFRLGDTIEVNLSDLMSYNQPVNAQELYEENTLYVCIAEREDYYTPSTEFIMFTTENYTDYTFTLPQDMEPGVYEVLLELNGWAIGICPIVVY